MDLRGMINDGEQVLHRGSVDKGDLKHTKGDTTTPKSIPNYARVYKGRQNQVKDPKRWELAETRPELAEVFDKKDNAPENSFTPTTNKASSISEIGPGGNESLTGLPASIALMIPADDQTKVLAGAIFEKLGNIPSEQLDNIEIEFKFGLIADEHRPRHNFPSLSESVVDPLYWRTERLRFRSEVSLSHFKQLETVLDQLVLSGSENHSFRRVNILTKDVSYQVQLPNQEQPSKIRVSFSEMGDIVECISKKRLLDMYISQPNSVYDMKMSLSVEEQVNYTEIKPQLTTPLFERNKNRLEWLSPGCQVDLTSVHAGSVSKEVEVECNSALLGSCLRNCRDKKDQALDEYLEVVRYTMDSARFLSRSVNQQYV